MIYSDKECTKLIKKVESDKKQGTVTFEDLPYNTTFYIKEFLAPKNYQLSDKVVEIKINKKGVFADGKKIDKEGDSIYKFEYENTKIPEVNTGSILSNTIIFTIVGISVIAIVVGIILLKKKN